MTRPYNLADQPWIGVLTTHGSATLSLTDTLAHAHTIRQVTAGDPLTDAAITQLLLAITIDSDGDTATWINDHRDQLDLFHPTHPFGQHAPLRDHPNDADDILALGFDFTAAEGAFSSYDSTNRPGLGLTLTPAEAARLLLVRQRFSTGGLLGSLATRLAGSRSANATTGLNFPFIQPDVGTLADRLSLLRNQVADNGGPLGTFHFHLPDEATLATAITNPGVLDVLTYPSRAINLVATDGNEVTAAHYIEGKRLDPTTLDPATWPYTTWEKPKKNADWQPRKAHLERPAWRQVLDAITTEGTQPGILSDGALPPGTPITMTTMCAYTSRLDGLYHQRTVTPAITADEVGELREHITATTKRIYADSGVLATHLNPSSRTAIDQIAGRTRPAVAHRLGDIVNTRLAGRSTAAATAAALRDLTSGLRKQHIIDHITIRPAAAARTAADYTRSTL